MQFVVGISDLKIATSPDTLITYALGSCVGICVYESLQRMAGLSHILLPNSNAIAGPVNKNKFADTAIEALIAEMISLGANKSFMNAKIVGGANMFAMPGESIGNNNVAAVKIKLSMLGIPIVMEDTGGNYGRTVVFYAETGQVEIRSVYGVKRCLEKTL